MLETCFNDQACDFMFHCDNGSCTHDQVFPLQTYPVLVYFLIPIACGLCNLTGNSMGMFKIMILMNLLRYQIGEATAIIQAVVIGAALPNFISIIRQKHPKGKTSLVNFNLVLIFIPCSLYGSTIGSLLQSILPQIIQDILICLMFTFFTVKFIQKVRKQYQIKNEQNRQSLLTTQETRQSLRMQNELIVSQNQKIESQKDEIQKQKQKQVEQFQQSQILQQTPQEFQNDKSSKLISVRPNYMQKVKKNKKKKLKSPKMIKLKKQIKKYELSIHLRDILQSFAVFLVFEMLAFAVQGKITFLSFSKCSMFYPLGIVVLTGVTAMYVFLVKDQMVQRFQKYEQINFKFEINPGNNKIFWRLVAGAFISGLIQGTLGVGAGTFLMVVMLSFHIDPRVAAATSGYQILFTGSGALTQQFINNKITVANASFFFLWTAILGGLVTYIMYRVIQKMDQAKVKRMFLIIIASLCTLSLILLFPVSIQRIIEKGWGYMFEVHFEC